MAIADNQSIMLLLLVYARDRQEHSLLEAIDALANRFCLTDEERKELVPCARSRSHPELFLTLVFWTNHLACIKFKIK